MGCLLPTFFLKKKTLFYVCHDPGTIQVAWEWLIANAIDYRGFLAKLVQYRPAFIRPWDSWTPWEFWQCPSNVRRDENRRGSVEDVDVNFCGMIVLLFVNVLTIAFPFWARSKLFSPSFAFEYYLCNRQSVSMADTWRRKYILIELCKRSSRSISISFKFCSRLVHAAVLNGKPQNDRRCIMWIYYQSIRNNQQILKMGSHFFQNGQRDAVMKIDVFTSVVESKGNTYLAYIRG